MNFLPGRFVFAVFFLISVTTNGDDADGWAWSVWDHNGLVLLLHWDDHIGGGGVGAQRTAPNERVNLSGHSLQSRAGPKGKPNQYSSVSAGQDKSTPALKTVRLQQAGAHVQKETSCNTQRTSVHTIIQKNAMECVPEGTNAFSNALSRTYPAEHYQKPATSCQSDVVLSVVLS